MCIRDSSYSVSHDLRTPLRAVGYLTRALLEDHAPKLDEDALDYVRRLNAESERLTRLIAELLSLARVR